MNQVQIPGEMLFAVKTRPETEWDNLFNSLIIQKSLQVSGCQNTEELIAVKAGVKALQEIQQFFLSEMRR